jgi:hypothetical protein
VSLKSHFADRCSRSKIRRLKKSKKKMSAIELQRIARVVHTHSVMFTRTLWFQHARVWFIYLECDFYTQSVISTRKVWFLHKECNFHTHSDVETQKCDNDTHDCDFNTHKSDFYTQSVMLTRMSVILHSRKKLWNHSSVWCSHTHCDDTRTSVISECKVWFQHAQVLFIYVECDFYTQCNFYTQSGIYTRRVWFIHAEFNLHTQSVIYIRRA